MRYLTPDELLDLHHRLHRQSGGATGLRDEGVLASALEQPQATFGGVDLYPTIIAKAAALGFSLIGNHPFVDGNKRIGHAAMEIFLLLNGYEIEAPVDEQESLILQVAAGVLRREDVADWLSQRAVSRQERL